MNIPPPPEADNLSIKDLRNWCEELYRILQFPSFHNAYLGTVSSSNFALSNTDGLITFYGKAGIVMTPKIADLLTLDAGTAVGQSLSDLQTLNDGNTFDIAEASATPPAWKR